VKQQSFDWTAAAELPLKVGLYCATSFSGSHRARPAYDGPARHRHLEPHHRHRPPRASGRDHHADLGPTPAAATGRWHRRHHGTAGTGGRRRHRNRRHAPGTGGTAAAGGTGTGGSGTAAAPAARRRRTRGRHDVPQMAAVISATWTPGEDIEKDPLVASNSPDVAIDGSGNVLVAWIDGSAVKVRRYNGTTRAWEAARTWKTGAPWTACRWPSGASTRC
jgi:hypothetical protein